MAKHGPHEQLNMTKVQWVLINVWLKSLDILIEAFNGKLSLKNISMSNADCEVL